MTIVGLRSRLMRWPIAGTGAARGRTERASILVEIELASGHTGLGEAAPLPGASADTLEDAAVAIAAYGSAATHAAPAHGVDDADDADALLATVSSPAARFALETAVLSARASTRNQTLADVLSTRPVSLLPCAIVVDDPDAASRAFAAGARCLKIKVGPTGDLDRVIAIHRAAPGATLRLDANRSWSRAVTRPLLHALADLPIEFVEEPCPDAHELLGEPLPCAIALDESLVMLTDAQLDTALQSPGLAALVLKPTLLGGLHACLALAARASAAGKQVVVTHALEGPIGTAACAELALAIAGEHAAKVPAGLAPHAALAGWSHAVEQLTPTTIRRILPGATPRLDEIRAAPIALDIAAVTATDTDTGTGARDRASSAAVSGPAAVLVATPTAATVDAIRAALDARAPLALLHHRLPDAELARQRALVESALLPADTAVVLFTSGSTGPARGVVLSRAALDAAAAASATHLGWRADDRWLLALSTAHAGGLAIVVRCHAAGVPVVLCDGDFDRDRCAVLLADCTLASLVPTQLAALLDDPAWRPPPKLRALLLGGAAASPALLERAAARGVPFLTSYGLTETFGQIATAPPDHAGEPTAPLRLLAGVEVAAGTREEPGPIAIRAPMLATSYLDGTPIGPRLTTADLGFVDDGVLHVVGRIDEVIVSGGEKVHPSVVEAELAATPGVRAACVFAVPDPRWGHIVGAVLAVDDGFDEERAAARWIATLAPHARPRELAIAAAVPLLPSGKVDRRQASLLTRHALRYPR